MTQLLYNKALSQVDVFFIKSRTYLLLSNCLLSISGPFLYTISIQVLSYSYNLLINISYWESFVIYEINSLLLYRRCQEKMLNINGQENILESSTLLFVYCKYKLPISHNCLFIIILSNKYYHCYIKYIQYRIYQYFIE